MKRCSKCGEEKPVSDFGKYTRRGVCRVLSSCRECKRTADRLRYHENSERMREKSKMWRYKHPEHAKKYYEDNKEAILAKAKEFRKQNPERRAAVHKKYRAAHKLPGKNWYLIKKFGISLDEYNSILDRQFGVCAICHGVEKTGRSLAVDHDHKTNRVRGLLCSKCNTAIGQIGDSPLIALNIASYLTNHLAILEHKEIHAHPA